MVFFLDFLHWKDLAIWQPGFEIGKRERKRSIIKLFCFLDPISSSFASSRVSRLAVSLFFYFAIGFTQVILFSEPVHFRIWSWRQWFIFFGYASHDHQQKDENWTYKQCLKHNRIILQWLLNVFIVERILLDPFHNFIDLCSIANIRYTVWMNTIPHCCLAVFSPSLIPSMVSIFMVDLSMDGQTLEWLRWMNSYNEKGYTRITVVVRQISIDSQDNLVGMRGLESGGELQTYYVSLPLSFRKRFVSPAYRSPMTYCTTDIPIWRVLHRSMRVEPLHAFRMSIPRRFRWEESTVDGKYRLIIYRSHLELAHTLPWIDSCRYRITYCRLLYYSITGHGGTLSPGGRLHH